MANPADLERLHRGVVQWNEWRQSNPAYIPDLREAKLAGANLSGTSLSGVGLRRADLSRADLSRADLSGANLSQAKLAGANLLMASLNGANLAGADLTAADLTAADLTKADLATADLTKTDLTGARLTGVNITNASFAYTVLSDLDLSSVTSLDTIFHRAPSSIDIDTVFRSNGRISEVFLRGCGVPDIFIQYVGSLAHQPIQYYSCFISYSTKDQDFAERLHNDLQAKGVRCWFAPHDMQAGRKIHEQIDEAIRVYDKLLLILSPSSMGSQWVSTEIAKARKREVALNRKMLFPVRLVQLELLRDWECFDADRGKDSAREIREYYIPDFSRWKTDADEYARELETLLRALKADSAATGAP